MFVNTGRFPRSQFIQRLRVETNDPDHRQETLMCNGRFLEAMHIEPAEANFARIRPTQATLTRTLTIRRGDAGPITPQLQPIRDPGLHAQLCEIEPGEHYELEVSLSPPWKQGRIRQLLRFETGVEEEPVMDIWVKGHVTPE